MTKNKYMQIMMRMATDIRDLDVSEKEKYIKLYFGFAGIAYVVIYDDEINEKDRDEILKEVFKLMEILE